MKKRFRNLTASLCLLGALQMAPVPACGQPDPLSPATQSSPATEATPPTQALPATESTPRPTLGVLLLDDRWNWEARRQERWPHPKRPGLVTDWRELLDPEVAGHLTPEQQALLLSDPRRLLASRHGAVLFRPQRLLLIGPKIKGRVSSLQVDLVTGARQSLEAP